MFDIVPQPTDYDKISLMSKTVILGTAGHIDHGKSSLVRALTGTDPDRLKEEKERGITIELGFARLSLPSGTLAGIVDVPGHERFVRTMVAGAAGVDIVLLVVAADEGVMPQTREHLDICRLLAVRHGIVVLNKCDKAESEWMDLQEEEIRALVRGTFLEGAPIVRVSAATGEGLPELVSALDRIAAGIPGKDSSNLFRLPVDRSFSMKGFGTVVTGTVIGGTVATGEEVAILPGGTVAKVRGLQVHGGPVERASAGTRTAVNLQGMEKESAPRGSVLCRPGTFSPTKSAEVFVEYLPLVPKPLRHRGQISFHAGTFSCVGRILLYGQTEIPPGGSGYGRVLLSEETVLSGGDRFILRGFSPLANFGYTIGGGTVLHPKPPARRGAGKAVPAALPRLRSGDPAERVLAAAEDAGAAGVTPADAAVDRRTRGGSDPRNPEGARGQGDDHRTPRLWKNMAPFGNFRDVVLLRPGPDAAPRPQSRTGRVPAGRDRLPVPAPPRPGRSSPSPWRETPPSPARESFTSSRPASRRRWNWGARWPARSRSSSARRATPRRAVPSFSRRSKEFRRTRRRWRRWSTASPAPGRSSA